MSLKTIVNLKSASKTMNSKITNDEIKGTKGYKAAFENSGIKMVKIRILKNGTIDDTFYAYATPRINQNDVLSSIQTRAQSTHYKLIIIKDSVMNMKADDFVNSVNVFRLNPSFLAFGPNNNVLVKIHDIIINSGGLYNIFRNSSNQKYLFQYFYPDQDQRMSSINNRNMSIEIVNDVIMRIKILNIIKKILTSMQSRLQKTLKDDKKIDMLSIFKSESKSQRTEKELRSQLTIMASNNVSNLIKSVNIEIKLYKELFLENDKINSTSKSGSR